jgi:hypothetical protein
MWNFFPTCGPPAQMNFRHLFHARSVKRPYYLMARMNFHVQAILAQYSQYWD